MSNDKKKEAVPFEEMETKPTTKGQSEFLSYFQYSALGLYCVVCAHCIF